MNVGNHSSAAGGWSLPLLLGSAGGIVWIFGEVADLWAGGGTTTAAIAGAGIILVSILPFELVDRQGTAWRSASYTGAWLLTVGAFLIGAKNVLSAFADSPGASMMAAVQQNPIDAVGGLAYLTGAAVFAAGLIGNGRFPKWQSALIFATAVVVAAVALAGAPQIIASLANIVLATVLILMTARAARNTV